jgi:proteasome accessory factor C
MSPQQKLSRIFKLIRYLAQKPAKTIPQLAEWLETDKRTVYRYLQLLEEIGYLIDKDFNNRYYLFEEGYRTNTIMFTSEETALVHSMMTSIQTPNPLLESIKRKIYLTSEFIPLADELLDIHQARIVQRLVEAIRGRKRVKLIKYHSTNSGQISDRVIEPISLTDNFASLDAYELAAKDVRTFKIQRIEDVLLLDEASSHAAEAATYDVFGFTGEPFVAKLNLSVRAYRLLIEEYPATKQFTEPQSNPAFPYRFVGEVRREIGIGRFILGLPNEIEVETPRLKSYLNKRIKNLQW